MLIVGSYGHEKVLGRKAKDIDILSLSPFEFDSSAIVEQTIVSPEGSGGQLIASYQNKPKRYIEELGVMAHVISLDDLYMMKMSHRYRKDYPHFDKTMSDIHALRKAGAKITNQDLYKLRQKETYTYAHPKLNVTKDVFFDEYSNVKYIYEHDYIHECVKLSDRPAYTYYSVDGQEVLSDKNKFFALPYEVQLNGVVEESMVLALERSIVPHGSVEAGAFRKALEKVCTSITSGWFREFAWENYYAALYKYVFELHGFSERFNQIVKCQATR